MSRRSRIRNEGYEAHCDFQPLSEALAQYCPYKDEYDRLDWAEGWMNAQALKDKQREQAEINDEANREKARELWPYFREIMIEEGIINDASEA